MTIICVLGFLTGCGTDSANSDQREAGQPTATRQEPWFEDVTSAAGINFVHVRATSPQYWLPEIMSGGAAWIDFDNDGDLDIYFVQGGELDPEAPPGPGNVLYENRSDGTFRDVTQHARVGDQHYGMGVAVGDYDLDGYDDLYITNVGPNVLYRNLGDGTFEDVSTQSGVDDDGWGSSAAFVDYDADGHMDLFVVNYLRWSPSREVECRYGDQQRDYCSPSAYEAPLVDKLFRNRGDGTFEDVSETVGLMTAAGNGLGVVVADFNQDGRLDFYVANDGNPNQLWIQDDRGRFQDQALALGCAVNRLGAAEAGMGAVAVDLDQDGDLDLFMTHLVNESNTLYINHGSRFDDATAQHGLAFSSLDFTGFGVGFADFNQDGRLDLFVANGRVTHVLDAISETDRFAEPNQLFQGIGQARFVEVMPRGGTDPVLIDTSRGAAFGDYNADGRTDVLVVNNNGPARLLANRAGSTGNWIRFHVFDQYGRDAIGARIRIKTTGGIQWRTVQRAYGYMSSNEPQVHFGLADATAVDEVVVVWPDRSQESFGPAAAGSVHTLRRGEGIPQAKIRPNLQ